MSFEDKMGGIHQGPKIGKQSISLFSVIEDLSKSVARSEANLMEMQDLMLRSGIISDAFHRPINEEKINNNMSPLFRIQDIVERIQDIERGREFVFKQYAEFLGI